MKINYQFNEQYKKVLKESTDLTGKVENLIFEPKVKLIFENESGSTAQYEIYPEMIFWWVDDVAGKFGNKNIKEYDDDIMGLIYYINWNNDKMSIYYNDNSKGKIAIFEDNVSKEEIYEEFRNLSKSLHKEMEMINPIVKKSKEWVDYHAVNRRADSMSKNKEDKV